MAEITADHEGQCLGEHASKALLCVPNFPLLLPGRETQVDPYLANISLNGKVSQMM